MKTIEVTHFQALNKNELDVVDVIVIPVINTIVEPTTNSFFARNANKSMLGASTSLQSQWIRTCPYT
ncbi:hypothetical protein SARC_07685 [Sphaeroforma arctica JP610]|uniref:Uncharacterized protein n=1 Tax=Sphaeroforma arctica JP610 TaxID=667725 RepID=A0A0L0FTN5_9EUKA|nr:hypothetical protein SARC_07685 [Sphaeroforma arctica JP610]KNC79936.1 hypothetical protein SARC_07685 [Sphaeroforma arctica JP610]|eukprot:XP_014153838.1 hypothetical protein SARC_07685 [Sphaeroforma arctica JP610]